MLSRYGASSHLDPACHAFQKVIVLPLNSFVQLNPAGKSVGHIVALRGTSIQSTKNISQELLRLQLQSVTALFWTVTYPLIAIQVLGMYLAPPTTTTLALTLKSHLFHPHGLIHRLKKAKSQIQVQVPV
jgi:hypothetical protein